MFCKYCGSGIKSDALFCQSCGKPVNQQKTTTDISYQELNQKNNSVPIQINNQAPIQPRKWEMDSPYGEVTDNRPMKATKKHAGRSVFIGVATFALIIVLFILVQLAGGIQGLLPGKNSEVIDLTDRPSLETIYTAGPLYVPEITYQTEYGTSHKKNVDKKTEAMLEITDEMMAAYLAMKSELYATINTIFPVLTAIDQVYESSYATDSKTIQELETLIAYFELQELKYYGMDIDATGEALYDSDLDFTRITAAMTATEKIIVAHDLLLKFSAVIIAQYENDQNSLVSDGVSRLVASYDTSTSVEDVATLLSGSETIQLMIQELDVYNALVALDNLTYMEADMSKIKEDTMDLLDSGKVDQEFGEMAVLMADEYEAMHIGLKRVLESYLEDVELEISQGEQGNVLSWIRPITASASSTDWYQGYNPQKLQEDGQAHMKANRDAYNEKYKNESYLESALRTARDIKRGTGEMTENIDIAVYEGMRLAATIMTSSEGDKYKDAFSDIKARHELAQRRKATGKSGEEVFANTVAGFEGFQNMAGDGWYNIGAFCEDQLGLPEDTVSQIASTMGNIAAESFTQFGQGVARILDPNAKNSDIAKGCLEISFSMAGGTNNIFSASKTGSAAIQKMGTVLMSPKLHAKGVIDAVKAIREVGLPKLGSLKYKEATLKGAMAALKKTADVAENMGNKLAETFTKDISGIFTKNWKDSLIGLKNYTKELGGNVDDAAVKLIDEFVNGHIDNKVTELASKPWIWDPNLSEEEKEAKLAEEIDKINEEIDQGLDKIQEELEKSQTIDASYFNGSWQITVEGETITFIIRVYDDTYASISGGDAFTKTEYYFSATEQTLELMARDKEEDEVYDFLGAKFKKTSVGEKDAIQFEDMVFIRIN
ncbi:MAG: hypothetical protein CVU98_12515 [Firmicutes bacterium HGW-Firmicutes-3]|nr:MAG: hypothetical protein CVU98_12515 [Firmicutes bacterium HGW-Firmicutes-3]